MKLRIKGNSIRLRVTQGELKQFAEQGRVEDSIDFGPGSRLAYRLCRAPAGDGLQALFADNVITVQVPGPVSERWCSTDEVSLRGEQGLNDGVLKLLVEKDFRCLTEREDEDESDMFDHPLAGGR